MRYDQPYSGPPKTTTWNICPHAVIDYIWNQDPVSSSDLIINQQNTCRTIESRNRSNRTLMDNSNGLKILNAESYDDGRGMLGIQRLKYQKQKQEFKNVMPFGVTNYPHIALDQKLPVDAQGGEGHKSRLRQKKHKTSAQTPDDERVEQKARGRPRVNSTDETAIDRRRTQIRMAQRAYRHRKEATISSLQKQVQDLGCSTVEMSNTFKNLFNFAIYKGLLQREPEFGRQLQLATKRAMELAKVPAEAIHEKNPRSDDI